MSILAITSWHLGEAERARELIDMANQRAVELGHAPSKVHPLYWKSILEILRGDAAAALITTEVLEGLCREHGMGEWGVVAEMVAGWARGRLADPAAGGAEMRQALTALINSGARLYVAFFQGLLAELELKTSGADSALARIDEALVSADQATTFASLPFLHRLRGDILLKRNPPDLTGGEDAYRTAIAVAKQQVARSYELLASLALAKLYQSIDRPAEAHAVLEPALEGFSPTSEMPEIAEAQSLLATLTEIEPVREALAQRQTLAKIHLDYARAVQWAKGWASEEARAAVERAHELTAPTPVHPDYWSLAYGRFAVALLRGEFRAALEIAETYLRQAEAEGRPDHAVNARRLLGTVKFELGAFSESRQEFEKLLEDWDEDRDKGLRAVTGADVLCVGRAYMAQLMVILGEVDDAVRMSEGAIRRAESLGDFGSLAFASGLSLFVLAMCGRNEATLLRAEAFEANASEKGARLWESIAREWASMARGLITGDAAGAATELRDIMAARRERQERQSAYMGHGVLAQLQVKAGAIDAALASIGEAFALAEQTGGHRADSFLHRIRGDVLAERDLAAAEAAYREALRIAQSQGARTFELQAAHALAKLHQSTGRFAEAHAILAPALEGFSPTPEMPEIAEAQSLLAALAEMDEVKNAAASRQRRLQLQTSYSQALMLSRGYGSEEAKVAFAHAQELAEGADNTAERFDAYYGQWVGSMLRGELRLARETAEKFLREAEKEERATEAAVARRILGYTRLFQGDLAVARAHFEQALRIFDPERDRETKFRFSFDHGTTATVHLALTNWLLGEVGPARKLIEEAIERAVKSAHAPTLADAYWTKALFDAVRDDAKAAHRAAESVLEVSRAHGLGLFLAFGALFSSWASARLGDRERGRTSFDRPWRRTPTQETRCLRLSSKAGSLNSKPRSKTRKVPWRGLTKRWRWPSRRESAGPTRSCNASAATFFSRPIAKILPAPRKPITRPSPSRASRARVALACKRRCRSRNSTSRPAGLLKRTIFSRPRSKVSRRRRKCRKLTRRGRCYRRWRRPAVASAQSPIRRNSLSARSALRRAPRGSVRTLWTFRLGRIEPLPADMGTTAICALQPSIGTAKGSKADDANSKACGGTRPLLIPLSRRTLSSQLLGGIT